MALSAGGMREASNALTFVMGIRQKRGKRHTLLAHAKRACAPYCPPGHPRALDPAEWLDTTQVRRYLTSMRTVLSSKGQIVLPAELRRQDQIRAGQEFDIERLDRGQYLLKKRSKRGQSGIVDWLLACPAQGWFCPLPSESTDEI